METKKNHRPNFLIDKEKWLQLVAKAENGGYNISAVIRLLLDKWLNGQITLDNTDLPK
jgi:hypothetical protein